MKKQVNKSHYEFDKYVHKGRWASIWHQLDEVLRLSPNRVLEVGPGPGIFKAAAGALGVRVETLDLDPDLAPDHLGSACKIPFAENTFDVVCAFQMLEHLPLDMSLVAVSEMARVARTGVIISLPDAALRLPVLINIPKIGVLNFTIPLPQLRRPVHNFDGEHYWEINKLGYSLQRIRSELIKSSAMRLTKTFRVPENPYHHFFVFEK